MKKISSRSIRSGARTYSQEVLDLDDDYPNLETLVQDMQYRERIFSIDELLDLATSRATAVLEAAGIPDLPDIEPQDDDRIELLSAPFWSRLILKQARRVRSSLPNDESAKAGTSVGSEQKTSLHGLNSLFLMGILFSRLEEIDARLPSGVTIDDLASAALLSRERSASAGRSSGTKRRAGQHAMLTYALELTGSNPEISSERVVLSACRAFRKNPRIPN